MHMFTERLQLLLSPEQRRRLAAEARRRGTSVASVVREAIDARLGIVTREERLRAVDEIRRKGGRGRFLAPDELDELAEQERAGVLRFGNEETA
jgi:predicted DNA-binding protein